MVKFNFSKIVKSVNKDSIPVIIAVIAIVVVGVLIFANGSSGQFLDKIKNFGGLSKEEMAQKSIEYINTNILSGQTASLVSTSEESGVIKIRISIDGNEFDSYISKDGKLLFPEAIKLEPVAEETSDPVATAKTCEDVAKTDSPELNAYVVSACPFGLQMQRVLADVVNSAPSLASNIKVRYIGSIVNGAITSMHGDDEATENLKQICIREEQASKYWKYVSCYIKAGETDLCLTSAGIDKTKLNSCTSDANKGLKYAQEDFKLGDQYNVSGSPTLILNNQEVSEFDFGGRTSEAIKSLICCGSLNQPSVCSTTLNTASAASSFSETYEGSGSGTAASCE